MANPTTPTTSAVAATEHVDATETKAAAASGFDNEDLIRKYPRSNKKIQLEVASYALVQGKESGEASQSIHISPYGIEFQATKEYAEGALLKIHVSLPDYWVRKQQFVDYRRIDAPGTFKILGKVVKSQDVGKRGKKKIITVQTVNMDEIDEKVLKSFLQEG